MECPRCGCEKNEVKYTKQGITTTQRARLCKGCGRLFMTFETLDEPDEYRKKEPAGQGS